MGQGLGIHGVVLDPGGRDRLGGQRMGHVGSDTGIGQQIREPAPAVGGLEHHLDRLGLELAEDAPELGGGVADPPRQHHLTGGIQRDHVRALAVQVHPDLHHDRACVLSLAQRRTLRRRALSTGAEARSFMASTQQSSCCETDSRPPAGRRKHRA
jgi:hypothetical protein